VTLAELLSSAASDLAGCAVDTAPGGATTWTRNKRPFVIVSADGAIAEFGLDPAVAAAAIRTPDTAPSVRGRGWVAFAPVDLDDHAADRAVAWFASAHRRVGALD